MTTNEELDAWLALPETQAAIANFPPAENNTASADRRVYLIAKLLRDTAPEIYSKLTSE